jgi:hypothetical protein
MTDQAQPASDPIRPFLDIARLMHAAMIERPGLRMRILDPQPFHPMQRTPPRAEEEIIQCRKRRIIVGSAGTCQIGRD